MGPEQDNYSSLTSSPVKFCTFLLNCAGLMLSRLASPGVCSERPPGMSSTHPPPPFAGQAKRMAQPPGFQGCGLLGLPAASGQQGAFSQQPSPPPPPGDKRTEEKSQQGTWAGEQKSRPLMSKVQQPLPATSCPGDWLPDLLGKADPKAGRLCALPVLC